MKKTQTIGSSLKWLLRRCFIFYFLIIAVSLLFVDYRKVLTGTRIRLRYFAQPEAYKELIIFLNDRSRLDRKKFEDYRYYYGQLARLRPQMAESYFLGGVMDYYLHNADAALSLFNKAIEFRPDIFLFYYNKGIILFEKKQYNQAIAVFQKAVSLNPLNTLNLIADSQLVYRPIILAGLNDRARITARLRNYYRNSFLLMILSYEHQRKYEQMYQGAVNAVRSGVGEKALFYYYQVSALDHLQEYERIILLINEIPKEYRQYAEFDQALARCYQALGLQQLAASAQNNTERLDQENKRLPSQTGLTELQIY